MRILCLLLLVTGLAFAQLDDNTVTVVASAPSTTPPPGSVTVTVTARTPAAATLEDALGAIAPVGLTENALVSYSPSTCLGSVQCVSTLSWTFRFTAPVGSLSETFSKLASAASGAAKGVSVSYSVNTAGSSAGPDCAYPTLISVARSHAANLASAAGLVAGRVVALSDGPAVQNIIPTAAYLAGSFSAIPVERVGDFSAVLANPMVGILYTPAPVFPSLCTAVVQFQLR